MRRRKETAMKKPLILLCAAAALMILNTGCSDSGANSDKSKGKNNVSAAASNADTHDTASNANDDETADGKDKDKDKDENTDKTDDTDTAENTDSGSEQFQPGDKLKKLQQIFEQDHTYSVKTSFSDDPENETTAVLTCQGEKVYITYSDKGSDTPDRAYWFDGTDAYDIDFDMGIYSSRDKMEQPNLLMQLIDSAPETTEAHPPAEMKDYTAEEYTFAGDTYITVFDLYFDKDDQLKKYTVTYTVEGEDDLVQNCEVLSLEQKAEINDDPLEKITDFDTLTEDERLGLCQKICGEKGISTDDMYEKNITTDDLKRIDYETFTELVYTYEK